MGRAITKGLLCLMILIYMSDIIVNVAEIIYKIRGHKKHARCRTVHKERFNIPRVVGIVHDYVKGDHL